MLKNLKKFKNGVTSPFSFDYKKNINISWNQHFLNLNTRLIVG